MKKISLLTAIAFFLNLNLFSQTIPLAQNIPYSQSFSTLTSTSTTYPVGWQGWKIGSSSGSTFKTVAPVADEVMIASGSASSTAGGVYNYNGKIGMLASGSIDPSVAFVVNLTGYTNSKVTVDISTIRNPFDGSTNTRYNNVELQFRAGGTSGAFTSLGSVYRNITTTQTGSGVTTPQNLKTITINLPASCDNQAVVQLRWVQRDSIGAGARPSFAFDNINVTGTSTQTIGFFRTKQSGTWNSVSTWEASADNSAWVNAVVTPKYTASTITIQSGHTVNFASTDTIDEVIVNGKLTYADVAGSTLRVNNGSGTDLVVNGTFEDFGPLNIDWVSGSRWSMGNNGNLIRSRSTSSDNWRDHYEGGIINIPATANWIIRKLSNDNPSLTSTGNMYYPNLIIENNTPSLWTTSNSSSFTGSVSSPVIKGNFDIGGNGSNNVSFINNNTNSSAVLVSGNFTIKSGSTLRNQGTGFEMQGDLTINGSIDNSIGNAKLILSDGKNQNISGINTITLKNVELNKSNLSATITLQSTVTISGTFTFTNGYLISSASSPLIFDNSISVSGAGNSSFVNGTVEKIGNTAFTFPIGKNGNYQPLSISAPSDISATYVAEYFHGDAGLGNNKDASIDSISNCEYWTLSNVGTAYPITVALGWNSQSCFIQTGNMRLAEWNGTKWIDLGNASITSDVVTSVSALSNFGTFTLGQKIKCETPNSICAGAIALQNDSLINQSTCDSVAWYSFVATGISDHFLIKSDSTNQLVIREAQVYSGSCTALSGAQTLYFMSNTGELRIYTDFMNAGETYFLKLKIGTGTLCQTCTYNANFNIYKLAISSVVSNAVSTSTVTCQLVGNSTLDANSCGVNDPSGPSNLGTIGFVNNWTAASSGDSPDYFSTSGLAGSGFQVPGTVLGNVPAHSGNSYIGFGCSSKGNVVDAREYIAEQLSCPIIAGQQCTVSVWYYLPPRSKYGISQFSAVFYNGAVQFGTGYGVLTPPAGSQQVNFTSASGFMNGSWTQITATFTANANYTNICFGNFLDDANTTFTANPNLPTSGTVYSCYYFVEDVRVLQNSIITISATDPPPVCPGTAVTLNVTGDPTFEYTWTNGSMIFSGVGLMSYTYTPSVSETWTVTANAPCCGASAPLTINVVVKPLIAVTPPQIVCINAGGTATVTVSVLNPIGTNYFWTPLPPGNTSPTPTLTFTVNSTGTTIYTVVGNKSTCPGTTAVTVNLNPLVSVSSVTVCSANPAVLTASGASTYVWSNGATGQNLVINPSVPSTYTVTGTTNGCSASAVGTVSVIPSPLPVTVWAPSTCSGTCGTVFVTNFDPNVDYNWNTGATHTGSIVVCPTATGTATYVVTATGPDGCTVQGIGTVNVYPNPTVTVTNPSICIGGSVTLTPSGATTYTWNTGALANSITVSPTVTTTYSVTGFVSPINCSGSATATVTINPLPVINVPSQSICFGSTATLTASGANTYSWNPGGATTSSITVTPTVTTSYTITGTDGNTCKNTTTATVTVHSLPNVTASSTNICAGSSGTIIAGGANTYQWNTGATSIGITVSPTVTTTYTVVGTDINGCQKPATGTVIVHNAPPAPVVIGGSENICGATGAQTYSVALASGITYTWSVHQTNGTTSTPYTFQGIANNKIQVNWANVTAGYSGEICVTAIASNFCNTTSCYTVAACCQPASATMTPTTLNSCTITATHGNGTNNTTTVPFASYTNQQLNYNTPVSLGGTANTPVFIYNTLTLGSGDFTIGNTDVTLGQDARILCLSGCSLTITRASHLHGCDKMWDKIDAQPGSHIIIIGASKIEDAIIGVAVNNNATIHAADSYFNKDKVGIWIGGHTSGSSADVSITNCVFTCRAIPFTAGTFSTWASYPVTTLKGTNSIPNNIVGTSGVEVLINSISFTIGTTAPNSQGGKSVNTFDNLSRGIVNQASTVTVLSNVFQNIHTTSTNNAEGCVRIYGGTGTTKTNVGNGNSNGSNTFQTSIRGIWEVGKGTLTVDKNDFTNVQQQSASGTSSIGILFEQWGAGTSTVNPVTIQNNSFNNNAINFTATSILGLNNTQVYASINHNTITTAQFNLPGTVGIRLEESSSGNSVRYDVTDNVSISGVTTGIVCNNLNGAFMTGTTLNYGIYIKGNKIVNKTNSAGNGGDVRITGCTGVQVFDNHLMGSGIPTNNVTDIGVYIGNSTSMMIKCNTIDGTGVPVKFEGVGCTPGSAYVLGNTLTNGTYGLALFTQANIGDIATKAGTSSDNIWGTYSTGWYSYSFNLANSGGFKIKHKNGAGYVPTGIANFGGGAIPLSATSVSVTATNPPIDGTCMVPPIANPGGNNGNNGNGSVLALKDFITNAIVFPVNDQQYKFIGKKDILHSLNKRIIDPSLDTSFSAFMNISNTNSLGQFYIVDSLMQNGISNKDTNSLNAANTISSNIVVTNTVEQNHKDVNALYLKYVKNDTLQPNEIMQAQTIAQLCPFTDGNAVYQARALLLPFDTTEYLNPCEIAVYLNDKTAIQVNNTQNIEDKIVVYPNPAENRIFILVKESQAENLQFTIFDFMGKQVVNKTLNVQNGLIDLDVKEIPNGIYFYKVNFGDVILKQERLIITR